MSTLGVTKEYLLREVEKQKKIAQERKKLYFQNKTPPSHKDQTVILVDDGIATGASILVAIQSLRADGVKKIVLAVPVAAPDSLKKIEKEVDEVVCLAAPPLFYAVGQFYKEFAQTTDEEIIYLLQD